MHFSGMSMGEVRIIILDGEEEEECSVVLDYDGVISDRLKDICSSYELSQMIINGLSDRGFFAEQVLQ